MTRHARESAAQFADPLVGRIADFLREIGLTVRAGPLAAPTFLPGIRIQRGELLVDETRLGQPGDLLHEAGHLAVAEPGRRSQISDKIEPGPGARGGEEMAAIAWSYAAAIHLDLDPATVFHADGYRGGAASLLENFSRGRYVGVPLLQWMGLTFDEAQARERGLEPYPVMRGWLRGDGGDPPT